MIFQAAMPCSDRSKRRRDSQSAWASGCARIGNGVFCRLQATEEGRRGGQMGRDAPMGAWTDAFAQNLRGRGERWMFPAAYAVQGTAFAPCRRSSHHERPASCTGDLPGPMRETLPPAPGRLPSSSLCPIRGHRSAHAAGPARLHAPENADSIARGRTQISSRHRGTTRQRNAALGAQGRGLFSDLSEEASCAKHPGTAQELFFRLPGGDRQKHGLPSACGGTLAARQVIESKRIKVCANCFFSVGTEAARP